MASLAGVPTGARGRRALDATLNLVPFIDLLSCCIAFLLITAVWTTVARIDVLPSTDEAAHEERASNAPPVWILYVARDDWTLRAPDGTSQPAARASLPSLPSLLRDRADALIVHAADDVPYAAVVDAVDGARGAGVSTVSVAGD